MLFPLLLIYCILVVQLLQWMNKDRYIIIKSIVYIRIHSLCCTILWWLTCAMLGIHHYRIRQKVSLTWNRHLWYSTCVSKVLYFPEHHIAEVIQYEAFSDWLLSFTNMHLCFLPVVSCLNSLFLFNHWMTFHYMDLWQVVYPFAAWRTSWLHWVLGNCE